MKTSILDYYNHLAKTYDENRFGNSYGQYIDRQEKRFLSSFFKNKNYSKVLDLGCGTGRLLNFASHGTDFSEEMLSIAQQKYPEKIIRKGEISEIPFEDTFGCIFCFHVIMHQDEKGTRSFLNECHKKLMCNGALIFDYPTKARRKVISKQEDWHAGNSFNISEIAQLLGDQFLIKHVEGVLLFPIHRFPKRLRKYFLPLDLFLCKTFMKRYASYHIVVLEKV